MARSPAARRRLLLTPLESRLVPAAPGADPVLHWHDVLLQACVVDNGVGYTPDQAGPTRGARAMAIVQAAVYDAVNSIDESYTPYTIDVQQAPGASVDAAVARAAHDALAAVYPKQRAAFDAALAESLAAVPGGAAAGEAVGAAAAAAVLAARADDGSAAANAYTPGTGPLDWQPDPLHPKQKALTPDWGFVKPFAIASGDQFRPAPPPDVNSPEYLAAFDEVRRLGGDGVHTPTERTAEQTEVGLFWGYDGQPGLCTPPRLYNQIVRRIIADRGGTPVQNARLLALVNLAMADAGVAAWECKYFYNFARPVTAIRAAAADGNPLTAGDPAWTPLGAPADNGGGDNFTPPFPAYTSGHATFGGAIFETLRRFYGTDAIGFTFLSDELNGTTTDQFGQVRAVRPRTFATLSQAEEENGQSRIYLGIHWAFDKTEGIRCGNRVADYVFDHVLRARPAAARVVVGADAGGGPRVQVLDGLTGRPLFDFFAFDPGFTGGVRVAQGDVDGDGTPDVVAAAGPGAGPRVRVFRGTDLAVLQDFAPYSPDFTGGVYVAAADLDGDGRADVVTGAGEGGGPHVRAFRGTDLAVLLNLFAFPDTDRFGVRVAAGDLDGDGAAEVVAAGGTGAAPVVRAVAANGGIVREWAAYDPGFTGGVYLACGDCDGDGRADVITGAGAGGGPHVRVFGPTAVERASYFALPADGPAVGVRVGCADLDGDGRADVVAAAGGGPPRLAARDTVRGAEVFAAAVFEERFTGGLQV